MIHDDHNVCDLESLSQNAEMSKTDETSCYYGLTRNGTKR